jgi:transposase, IS30 family
MFYTHLTLKERFRIEILLSLGWKQCDIALDLKRREGSISKEINRNGGIRSYNARQAHSRASRARKQGRKLSKKLISDTALAALVEEKLLMSWSPEQISGRLGALCPETIYQWIYTERRDLISCLRRKKDKYRRRHGTVIREKRRESAKKRRVDTRPTAVEDRKEIGHWEGDTIVGGEKTTGIATHVERVSGYLIADLLLNKKAIPLANRTIKSFRYISSSKKKTVTYDNGSEFAEHEIIEKKTGMTVYFAYPYHSWERGTNENTNGLLREYFPKKTLFGILKQKDVDDVVNLINHRPRKRLGYLTPHEVFIEEKTFASN